MEVCLPRPNRPWSSSEYFGTRQRQLYLVSDELVEVDWSSLTGKGLLRSPFLEKCGLFLLGVAFAGGGNGFFFDYQNAAANWDMCTRSFRDPIPETCRGACGDARAAHISPLLLTFECNIRVSDVLTLLIHSMLPTAVIVFVSAWRVPAWRVNQSTRSFHHRSARGGSLIVPDSPTAIRFERRCKPRMSPNGPIVIRVTAMIFHRPHNVRFFPHPPDISG